MQNPFQLIGRAVLGLFAEIGRLAVFSAQVMGAAFTPRWYGGQILSQMVKIGFYSLPVVGMSAVFIGAALALNIYEGGSRYGAEQFVPSIVVLGITRELGVVITGLMLAGRVTAGIAAEIGAMRVTEQIDALETLSASRFRYLYAPRFIAALITLPMLVALADIIGVMGGWLVSVYGLDFDSTVYLRNTLDFVTRNDILAGLIKAVVFGGVIAVMGCYQGDRSQAGATGVGRAATLSMVGAAVLILAFNYIMSTIFVEIGL
ncbi:ABC transporter permease [Hyphomonas sp. CACIAM 19H1]|uniref:MlaE family ABC transporter permease n=1 Tax=Hyphomonas sp. CACIAM 19H1 TaxID=1873716 RepID=UPI000DEE0342|nr:ABC transporter permease [Hyphomonas sp. CACIAM 19H1]AXE63325.1 ABC transporter permease [Hyphomonas sp. CACIAM 19H1]